MHSDELRKLNEGIEDPALYKIINELITRSDLHTAAIVGDTAKSFDEAIEAIRAHVAPKKKYTVEDINVVSRDDSHNMIRCGDMWISAGFWHGWTGKAACAGVFYNKQFAEIYAAGLRATNNLPEEYK